MKFTEFQLEITPLRYGHGVGNCFRFLFKVLDHLLGGFEVQLICAEFHPVFISNSLSSLNAQEDIMCFSVRPVQIMAIIRSNKG